MSGFKYRKLETVLHDCFLGNKFIYQSLFDLERALHCDQSASIDLANQKHIFIFGLPRAGTTAMTYFLHGTGEFASLTYRDMPFLCAPNIFRLITDRSNSTKLKRYHQDGIEIDLDTPEAFDEFFFMSLSECNSDTSYRDFIYLVTKKYRRSRYLSKNNALINQDARLRTINEILPMSRFVLLFRSPLNQAHSLYSQNLRFEKLHAESLFSERYMRYLGHFDFGNLHKPWREPISFKSKNSPNYWLEQWILAYEAVLASRWHCENCLLVCYEDLANLEIQAKLLRHLQINRRPTTEFVISTRSQVSEFNPALSSRAMQVYNGLIEFSNNWR